MLISFGGAFRVFYYLRDSSSLCTNLSLQLAVALYLSYSESGIDFLNKKSNKYISQNVKLFSV